MTPGMEALLALFPLWYVAFLMSLTCHEAAHALVAKWGGDLTAYHSGQVTLNPLPHIQREPFGTVLVPIISLFLSGWIARVGERAVRSLLGAAAPKAGGADGAGWAGGELPVGPDGRAADPRRDRDGVL